MGYNDYGLVQLGSWIRGLSPSYCGSMAFGSGSKAFAPTESYLESESFRVPVTWSWNGTFPKGSATITQADANGSILYELGLASGGSVGSDLHTRDTSAIGPKDATFSVNVTMEVNISR